MSSISALIHHVKPVEPLAPAAAKSVPVPGSGNGFSLALHAALETVDRSQKTAAQAVEGFLNGTGGELHSTILATQRAELELQMFLQVRNKVLSAYQEIMRAQV